MTLHKRISLWIAGIMGGVFLTLAVIIYFLSYDLVFQEQDRNLENSGILVGQIIERQIDAVMSGVAMSGKSAAFKESLDSADYGWCADALSLLVGLSPYFENAFIVNVDGKIVWGVEQDIIDTDAKDWSFYKGLKDGTKELWVDSRPSISPITGNPVIILAVPVRSFDSVVGYVAASFDLIRFSDAALKNVKVGKAGYAYVMDTTGRIILHPDHAQIMQSIADRDYIKKTLETGKGNLWYTSEGTRNYQRYVTLENPQWIVCTTIGEGDLMSMAYGIIGAVIIMNIAAVGLLVAFVVVFFRRIVVTRLHKQVLVMDDVARGRLDLRVEALGDDELSHMANGFNNLLEQISGLIRSVKDRMHNLQNAGGALAEHISGTVSAITQINSNIDSTRVQIENQAENISDTSAVIEELASNVESLDRAISNQTKEVENASSAIEQMIASIQSINNSTEMASKSLDSLETASAEGRRRIEEMNQGVIQIAAKSNNLMAANKLIKNVASQTNLLAMNAAIEAAHAGEYGRGFAVVADEIRQLAEQSQKQSSGIEKDLKEIKAGIEHVVASSVNTSDSFARMQQMINEVLNVFEGISQSMEEQALGSRQILESLSTIKDVSREVESGSREMTSGNQRILNSVGLLNQITTQVRAAMEEITVGTREINDAISHMLELSESNKSNIESVEAEVQRFTV